MLSLNNDVQGCCIATSYKVGQRVDGSDSGIDLRTNVVVEAYTRTAKQTQNARVLGLDLEPQPAVNLLAAQGQVVFM